MRESPLVDVFRLAADDPAAGRDVPAFAREIGWACTEAGELEWLLTRHE